MRVRQQNYLMCGVYLFAVLLYGIATGATSGIQLGQMTISFGAPTNISGFPAESERIRSIHSYNREPYNFQNNQNQSLGWTQQTVMGALTAVPFVILLICNSLFFSAAWRRLGAAISPATALVWNCLACSSNVDTCMEGAHSERSWTQSSRYC